ncbi:MAG: NADH:flavin oxidoreductase [Candidatus Lindowbacteria bacterium]|nr:NADH:flavin oxidoreductase [Candidatus Lindowbacteria bacterium]
MAMMFDPVRIKNLSIRNRIARSATYEGMGNHRGEPTKQHAQLYNALAEGGVGLIFTGATMLERFKLELPEGADMAYPTFIHDDAIASLWKPIVADVHARGAAIAMQVVHAGRQEAPVVRGGDAPIAPSAVQEKTFGVVPREMTIAEIKETIENFAQAARRVKSAGFDAIQLHGGHGYLISNFISPYTNRRTDEYGGDTERRARFIVDIIRRSREMVGDYPILIKMNCDDFVLGGLDKEEAARVAATIAKAGIDCIEITAGIYESMELMSRKAINSEEKEAYLRPYAEALRKAVNTPLILVGGMRSPAVIERILSDGVADMVSLSRPFIREPGLVKRWKAGDLSKAACVSCNQCSENTFTQPMCCYVEEALKAKKDS